MHVIDVMIHLSNKKKVKKDMLELNLKKLSIPDTLKQ